MNIIGLDYETFFDTREGYGIRELGAWRYCHDSRFDPYLLSIADGDTTWAGSPKNFNWDALEGATLLSHNKYFDSLVYERMVELGTAPRIKFADWHCTANLSTYRCMRRDLKSAAHYLLGHTLSKAVREDADGRHWGDYSAEDRQEMLKYAGSDARECRELWMRESDKWPLPEQRLSNLTIRQGQRGVQINVDLLRKYLDTAYEMLRVAELDLPWMKSGKKPTSPKAVAEECRKAGIPCAPVKTHDGVEAYDDWAIAYSPNYPWVKAYTDYRVINKFISTLETIKTRMSDEGIFRFDLLYFGAHTGRWAGAGGFNMQNMRKEPLFCDHNYRMITHKGQLIEIRKEIISTKKLPSSVMIALDIRALFTARPGKKLILSDLSQIEPRVLAWFAGDDTMLGLLAKGQSPYEAHARSTMKWIGGELKSGDPKLYSLAKARVLGLGYGCGWKKFITVAQVMAGLDITEGDPELVPVLTSDGEHALDKDGNLKFESGYGFNSRRIVKDFRDSNPLTVNLWKALDDQFRQSLGEDCIIGLPSGRELRYPDVRQERKAVADPEDPKKIKHKWVYTAMTFDQDRRAILRKPFYGGLLCENLVQATARDVFAEHLLSLDDTPGIETLWSVHDEAINEVDLEVNTKDVERIMSVTPEWLPGCPISAQAVETPCYLK